MQLWLLPGLFWGLPWAVTLVVSISPLEAQMPFQSQLWLSCGVCWISFASGISAHYLCMVWWEMCWLVCRIFKQVVVTSHYVLMVVHIIGSSKTPWHRTQTLANQCTPPGTPSLMYTLPGVEYLDVLSCLCNCFYRFCCWDGNVCVIDGSTDSRETSFVLKAIC